MKPSFRDYITNGGTLLVDGATGTELYNRGLFINRCYEEANLSDPALIRKLYEDYLASGADVLSTNSWGANRYKLKKYSLNDRVADVNKTAVEIAKTMANDLTYIAGSVGPLGVRVEPWGPTSLQECREAFSEQIGALVEAGCDYISLETFSELSELHEAIKASQETAPDTPIVAHITIDLEGKLPLGTPLSWAIHELESWGVFAVGLNCCVGPGPMLKAIDEIRSETQLPISVAPNAGLPKMVDGRSIYMCSPEYMGEYTKNFLQAGVQMVGGCCGTTPDHIKTMASAFRHYRAMAGQSAAMASSAKNTVSNTKTKNPSKTEVEVNRVPLEEKSNWSSKIVSGKKVVCCELLPPAGVIPKAILEKSALLKQAGIDAINIPDGPRASARMSAIITAILVEQKVGIETILHYTCRDRNLVGMQSDMLGAHAVGLRNLLMVTGDPPKIGSYPDATGVFDVDAIGLTNMVHRLNGGTDLGQRDIGPPTSMSIGVGVNPVHRDIEYEMKRFEYKVEAGAEWAITQPVFDLKALDIFLESIEKRKCSIPIVAGIWPLVSHRNAVFMNNEVPGVVIPDDIISRMEKAATPEDAKKIGVEIAAEMVERILPDVAGIQISAPFGRIDLALDAIAPMGIQALPKE